MQPLHYKCANGHAMTDNHELIDTLSVVIAMKGSERLMNPYRNIEPTLPKRHPSPEFSFKFDLFVVVCGFARKYLMEHVLWNAIEQAKLLFYEVDVFPSVESQSAAVAFVVLIGYLLNAPNQFICSLSCPGVWRYPKPRPRVSRVVLQKILAQPLPREECLLPAKLCQRNGVVGKIHVHALVSIPCRFSMTYEYQLERRHRSAFEKMDVLIKSVPVT